MMKKIMKYLPTMVTCLEVCKVKLNLGMLGIFHGEWNELYKL